MPAPGSAAPGDNETRSASAIVGDNLTGHHLLHIDGYSRTKDKLPTGKSIKSCPFRAGGHRWRINYYPNGQTSNCADFISVFLHLEQSAESDTRPVKARAKFSLLDRAGKPVPSHSKYADLHDAGWRIYNFIKRVLLENSGHLKDDCFKIRCDVIIPKILYTKDRAATPSFFDVPASDIFRQLGDLLRSKDGADVMFQVAGKTFWAHRFILGARSPVFKDELLGAMAELLGGMKESRAIIGDHIQIDDILPQVFETLLHFVYNDSLPEMEGQEEAMMAQHLLEAADRYDMQRLKLICEDKLCRHLDVSTVATTLVLAEQHNCQGLKEACIEFLKSSDALEAVMETDGFDHMAKSCPALIKELMLKLVTRSRKRK
ncbi:hypothetical protein HU200_022015 [Digitaria exilis]|uniref:Uncharacterized protein n=1 Tax=Digitaria exilis TaxID=1010633 RepID=A0A835C4W1_9POAL|nr:hypothetical protein HU200_022015 [Digitaria exilis]